MAALAITAGFWALGTGPVAAQQLDQYDYGNLRLRGGGADIFITFPNNTKSTLGFGGRVDFGYLGPQARLMVRGGYWGSELSEDETLKFSRQIEELVNEQNPGADVSVDLGDIKRSALFFGVDLHWMPRGPREIVRPYLGLGGDIYFLNGSGDAINDTFVEGALDLFTAGISGVAGLEFGVGGGFTFYTDLRGSLVADVSSINLSVGLAYLKI